MRNDTTFVLMSSCDHLRYTKMSKKALMIFQSFVLILPRFFFFFFDFERL